MTGPEHFREAERLAKQALDYEGLPNNSHIQIGQVAQVHATLALAAATALGHTAREGGASMPDADRRAWFETASSTTRIGGAA